MPCTENKLRRISEANCYWFARHSDVLKREVFTCLPTANDNCHAVSNCVAKFSPNSDQCNENTGATLQSMDWNQLPRFWSRKPIKWSILNPNIQEVFFNYATMRVMQPIDSLFILSLFSHNTSTCFGLTCCPSSGGNNVYMQQMIRGVRCRLKSHHNQVNWQSTTTYNTHNCRLYTLLPPDDGQLASPKHVEV
jgi:hypothetical protein